jgi:Mn-dependent DtxR family transcriptional regulator
MMKDPKEEEVEARILEILIRGGSATPDSIAKELGMPWRRVEECLLRMQADGRVKSH